MSNLKRLVVTLCLMSTFAIAGYGQSGSCPAPGETQAPPCTAAQQVTDDSTTPGQMDTTPATETVVIDTIVDVAVETLLSVF